MYRLGSPQTFEELRELVHGATRPRINLGQLKAYQIGLPPIEEQREIVTRIEAAFKKIERLGAEAKRSLALLDRLEAATLAHAFSGRLLAAADQAALA